MPQAAMIRIRTASRLHFGLLSFPCSDSNQEIWPNLRGEWVVPARRFGGVGLMIEAPGIELTTMDAAAWSATGPHAERVLAYARRVALSLPSEGPRPQHFNVVQAAPEHAGLGTGTQLGLAVALAMLKASGMAEASVADLAGRAGRGARSALGVHGFAQGGFLVEAGKRHDEPLATLIARATFPETWRVVVAVPPGEPGIHGRQESQAFEHLRSHPIPVSVTEALCRLVLLGLLPALKEGDFQAFGEALFDFNARVGGAFAPVQGGTYASARIAEVVQFIRRHGVAGVGQSSWGPAVFAVVLDEDSGERLVRLIRQRFSLDVGAVWVTRACNIGALFDGEPVMARYNV
jgi:beta-RFAP synthase